MTKTDNRLRPTVGGPGTLPAVYMCNPQFVDFRHFNTVSPTATELEIASSSE